MSFNIPTEKWTTEEMEEEACGRYYSSYIDVIIGRSFKNEKFLKRNTNYVETGKYPSFFSFLNKIQRKHTPNETIYLIKAFLQVMAVISLSTY